MGDRKVLRRLFESVLGDASNLMSTPSAEATKVVQHRVSRRVGTNINANTSNLMLDFTSTTQLSDNCYVESFEIIPSANVTSSSTNYCTLTLWKTDQNGANKKTIAAINTANLTATSLLFTAIAGNLLTTAANNFILTGCTIGVDATQAAAGQAGFDNAIIMVTLRAD